MRLPFSIMAALTFVLAAGLCLVAAGFAVTAVEDNSEIVVRRALDDAGHDWAEVEADGLRVILTGMARDEATRFNALSVAGAEVDASRVIDRFEILPTADLDAPRFSAEILRNGSGISIIGLIPSETDRAGLVETLQALDPDDSVSDLLETADYPVPEGWHEAMGYAVTALRLLDRAKISVDAGRVSVTAMSDSGAEKERLEAELTRAAPPSLRLGLDIAAPRPVITPFILRYLIDDEGSRFDACSAESNLSRNRIVEAARQAGTRGDIDCTIGLGVPSPTWASAAERSISALAELGRGSVTISDADITLIAAEGTEPALFDRVVGELENTLPPVFALHAVLTEPEEAEGSGPPEFVATLSPEGLVQLSGRLGDETTRTMVASYAKAAFGSDVVHTTARVVPDLPAEWPVRVLTGIEALSLLRNGALRVTPELVTLRGVSHQKEAKAVIARLLSEELGEAQEFELEITYQEPPEPEDAPVDPEICQERIAEIQSGTKITFDPGSTDVAAESLDTMNRIADVLRECGDIRLEIQGHTDSQGREEMNQQLSQARAQSVLNELRARRVPTSSFVAVGYGESEPIAENDTEDGREANRRIEFRLIRPEPVVERETGLEAIEPQPEGNDGAGEADPDGESE
ncbi:OmpA-OmpF porin, OOP family [Cribrihabitans marinus]|uniref:OmpA-OmpF porin, OOP family n=1 Tax=Cribrihabitans marinus TaxID=1227549 RepID=A0A1H7CJS8_9RHOB|nr:OmpA family protein [Cribrihabitans marinus]GGH35003.1 membrane protein [Cribrihabitans marinus]SEJ86910.1 OmpA-OmpF porin, OOP family [Cribrihabitans marinus]